jgi:simple sugar transport system permease protein
MELVTSILSIAIFAGTSLVFATLGEIFAERAGILNLGLEGMMIMGAVTAFATGYHTDNAYLGVLVAMVVGGLLGLLHAMASISLRSDQVVAGLALTIGGSGLASFLGQKLGPGGGPLVGLIGPKFVEVPLPWLSSIPVIGEILFNKDQLVYLMYLLVPLAWWFLYKTRPGLHLRAVGENPQATDALGVNVFRLRYTAVVAGGALAGLGGAHLSLAYTPGWTENLTGGRGWIAIALVIFATWNPARAVLGALLFGGVNAIQFRLQAEGTTISANLLNMTPYILTVVVLVAVTYLEAFRRRVGAPAALGLPYNREERM